MTNYENADEEVSSLIENILEEDSIIKNAKIKYLFKVKGNRDEILGQCRRATGPWKLLTDYDFVIIFNRDFWEIATDTQKRALLFHELLHIKWREPTEEQEGRWLLKKHDIELFIDVIHKFGCWKEDLGVLRNVIKDKELTFEK